MTLVVDTGPILAVLGGADPRRPAVLEVLTREPGPLIVSSPVIAEIDYLAGRRYGEHVRRGFLLELAAGRFTVPALDQDDYAAIVQLGSRYADLGLGLADCSVAVLAARYETTRILTFDERHFRVVTAFDGSPFTILPADA